MLSESERIHRRQWLANSSSAVGALALVACGGRESNDRSRRPLRVGIDLWAGYFPLLIAVQRGDFAAAGLEVEVQIPENTNTLLANFAAMNLDAIAVALGDIINVTQRNPHVRAVMVSDQSDGGDVIVAPVPFAGVESVRGKRVGTNIGGFGEILVRAFLERHRVKFDEIELVDVDAAEVPDRLRAGAIDIGHTWEPYGSQALREGCHFWFTSHEVRGLIPSCVAFQRRVIDDRRADVQRFLDLWLDAQEWWRENVEAGAKLVAAYRGVETSESVLKGVRLVGREENRRIFENGGGPDSVYEVARYYVDHFTSRGMLTRPPHPDDFIDSSFMVSR
jgi:NitT/TauT family transport system substrate-binding protein